jgi:mono/diheme cytochrome c family protein
MQPRIGISLPLIVLMGFSAAGIRDAHAQKIVAGKYAEQSGEALYKSICQGCHMPDAKGAIGAGAYPALASNARLLSALYPIAVVLNGQRAMPPFGADLSDVQIANVINYVREHFGNHYTKPVSAAAVRAARR